MKLYYCLAFLAAILFLTSCSSDDDGDMAPDSSLEEILVGTWERTEAYAETSTSGAAIADGSGTSTGRDFEGTVTFNSDPNTWETDWSAYFDVVSVFSVEGLPDFEETSVDYSEFNGSGTWSINSDGQLVGWEVGFDEDLSQYEGQIDQVYDIEVVNNDRLILSLDIDFTAQDPEFGVSINVTGTGYTVLERK